MKIHDSLASHIRQFSAQDVNEILALRHANPSISGKQASLLWAVNSGRVLLTELPAGAQQEYLELAQSYSNKENAAGNS